MMPYLRLRLEAIIAKLATGVDLESALLLRRYVTYGFYAIGCIGD